MDPTQNPGPTQDTQVPNQPQQPTPQPVPVVSQPQYVPPTSSALPSAQYAAPATSDPGKTLAIISLILAFFFNLAGLVLAIVAKSKSKKAGFKNSLATVSIVVNVVVLLLSIVAAVLFVIALIVPAAQDRATANNFSSAIRSEDYQTALGLTDLPQSDNQEILDYFAFLHNAIGSSQTETDSATTANDTRVLVYSVSGGDSKYYKIAIKDDKVTNAVVSDTQLTAGDDSQTSIDQ